jgi:extradiol dioxygenase family protein
MINRFHLAIPAGDLDVGIKFYCGLLGCDRGNVIVAGGYTYTLLDIFNLSPIVEAKKITAQNFKKK